MQVVIEGDTWRSYPGRVIEYAGTPGNPNAVNTSGTVSVAGAVVQARSLESGAGYPLITLTTNEDGYLPGHLLPDLSGTDVQCVYTFGGFDFPGWSDDVPGLAVAASDAAAAVALALSGTEVVVYYDPVNGWPTQRPATTSPVRYDKVKHPTAPEVPAGILEVGDTVRQRTA